MKLPNGYGSVFKLSGNRRNPWIARITTGWKKVKDKRPQPLYQVVGYYPTRSAALQALADYNSAPYDISKSKVTFAEVYEKWSAKKFAEITPSAARTYKSAYSYCSELYDVKMSDLRPAQMQHIIDTADVGATTRARIKSLFNLIYDYCLLYEIVQTNYADVLVRPKVEVEKEKVPFTRAEIQTLWDNLGTSFVNIIIIMLYTGWRAGEIVLIKHSDVTDGIITGGIKTESGKNRQVPIHHKIQPLIDELMAKPTEYLITDDEGNQISYSQLHTRFIAVMNDLGMDHRPHETRHTFITELDNAGANKTCIKRLVGHKRGDVTEKVYTHKDIEQLRKTVELLDF